MAEQFEFELVFALPEGEHDAIDLSNAVFDAGFEIFWSALGFLAFLAWNSKRRVMMPKALFWKLLAP